MIVSVVLTIYGDTYICRCAMIHSRAEQQVDLNYLDFGQNSASRYVHIHLRPYMQCIRAGKSLGGKGEGLILLYTRDKRNRISAGVF